MRGRLRHVRARPSRRASSPRSPLRLAAAAFRRHDALERAWCVDDLRALARRRLPRMVFDFIDGAAAGEQTARANRQAFLDAPLVPRVARGVSSPGTARRLLGADLALPVVLGPAGLAGLVHPDAVVGAATAARRAGTAFTASMMMSAPFAEIAAAGGPSAWFQLYLLRDRATTEAIVADVATAGCEVIVVTLDTQAPGLRLRDLRNGFSIPPVATKQAVRDALSHPLRWGRWTRTLLRGPGIAFGNLDGRPLPLGRDWHHEMFNPHVTWEDVRWLRSIWPGRLAAKGVMHPEDARRAAACGCDAVIVSNHGGRQLDGGAATAAVLPQVSAALRDEPAQVLVDGGVRSGADIVRALALGADGCLVARPWMWALGAGGGAGVARLLEILREDLVRALVLAGAPSVDGVGPHVLRRVPSEIAA